MNDQTDTAGDKAVTENDKTVATDDQAATANNQTVTADDNADFFHVQYRKFIRFGLIISAIFVGLIVLSATLIKISGAVTAPGVVAQLGKNKSVQHTIGGPVKHIYIAEGDEVTAGDKLIILDGVQIEAQLALLEKQSFEQQLILDRLQAMLTGRDIFVIDESKYGESLRQYAEIVATQQSVFVAQLSTFLTSKQELQTRIEGLKREQLALDSQLQSNDGQLQLADQSTVELQDLYDRQLISKSRLVAAQTEKIRIETQIKSLQVAQVQTRNSLDESQKSLKTLINENQQRTWEMVEQTSKQLAETQANIESVKDQFSRLEITAPVSGRIHELAINNINAVVQPGEVILQIVPTGGAMVINSQVTPTDIEQLYVGQETRIRFDAFDAQTTPEIKGKVLLISADSIQDPTTNMDHYIVQVSLDSEETSRIKTGEIITGLPVTTMFTTNDRTMMNYLIKPLKTQLFSAFREN